MDKNYEQQRQKLWCDVYVAYVSADNSTESKGATKWADDSVKRFDDRFKPNSDSYVAPPAQS